MVLVVVVVAVVVVAVAVAVAGGGGAVLPSIPTGTGFPCEVRYISPETNWPSRNPV